MKKVLSVKEQEKRAMLISPFFYCIVGEKGFQEDVELLRVKYGISRNKKGIYDIPLYLLNQRYWDLNVNVMKNVKVYPSEMRKLWEEFHKEIEHIAEKYYLRNFPDILKAYILTGRFENLFSTYALTLTDDRCDISIRPWIKKGAFNKIWDEIQKFNNETLSKRPWYFGYPNEVIEKYKTIEKIWNKYAGKGALLLLKEQLFNNLTVEQEDTVKRWSKYEKSRLNRIAKNLSSLVRDLNKTEK